MNNKNEDSELDLQDMADQYEVEIEQILKETADKASYRDLRYLTFLHYFLTCAFPMR